MQNSSNQKITLIGAGLAGSLMAIFLAKRGFRVEIFEKRGDMRKTTVEAGRSINLALSSRGIRALQGIGIAQKALQTAIPMYGRMLHDLEGNLTFVRYGKDDSEYINSISRAGLNRALLEIADDFEEVTLHFYEQLTEVNFEKNQLTFLHTQTQETHLVESDIWICADGAGSVMRQSMLQFPEFQENVSFLAHGYKELTIPPTKEGGFRIEKNALHIWPRGSYMLIALPNLDGSFTCTLFFPNEGANSFESLNSADKVRTFFQEKFFDTLGLIPHLEEEFLHNPVGLLGTVRCFPWRVEGKALLLGDSAHAIVPFYGQGMNCAFEDCVVLDILIEKHKGNWEKIFSEYEQLRKPNADAIATLAIENFYEMRDGTADPAFLLKRQLEHILENQYVDYHSKYSLVTFHPEVSYQEAHQRGNQQDALLLEICKKIDSLEQLNVETIYKELKEKIGF